jgi:hypothetical protein
MDVLNVLNKRSTRAALTHSPWEELRFLLDSKPITIVRISTMNMHECIES